MTFNRQDTDEDLYLDGLKEIIKRARGFAKPTPERDFWDDYTGAYERMIQGTATKDAPWYVVPADNKWFTCVVRRGGGRSETPA
mgnify:CR=1 FL=1